MDTHIIIGFEFINVRIVLVNGLLMCTITPPMISFRFRFSLIDWLLSVASLLCPQARILGNYLLYFFFSFWSNIGCVVLKYGTTHWFQITSSEYFWKDFTLIAASSPFLLLLLYALHQECGHDDEFNYDSSDSNELIAFFWWNCLANCWNMRCWCWQFTPFCN